MNQYKLEVQFATRFGVDGDQEAWAFISTIQKALESGTPQINYTTLAKQVESVWVDRYPRNKTEFEQAVKYKLQEEKNDLYDQLMAAERVVEIIKQELEKVSDKSVSDKVRSQAPSRRGRKIGVPS